ncbi:MULTISPECIES: deoxynucleoside kinase [unclassified Exiguobacterium]|uniref:deoxynucleoside kinase n=1 Tax=unclassified Exiguobacterium TaxID=2644629 RepID=UPI003338DAC3
MEKIITIGGMIGLGKTSVSELLGRELNLPVYYESVDDNPVLARFYTASVEEQEAERLPFLLQLYFLGTRFKSIKQNIHEKQGILDRSIFEDVYFAKRNAEFGKLKGENRISDMELQIYLQLFDEMMKETEDYSTAHGTKAPDLMVYLKASFETVLERIGKRGRDFEQDEALVEYYRFLWEGYDEWIHKHYKASNVLIVDMDNVDVVNNPEDAKRLTEAVKSILEQQGEK